MQNEQKIIQEASLLQSAHWKFEYIDLVSVLYLTYIFLYDVVKGFLLILSLHFMARFNQHYLRI
jgi:hypothetical protein